MRAWEARGAGLGARRRASAGGDDARWPRGGAPNWPFRGGSQTRCGSRAGCRYVAIRRGIGWLAQLVSRHGARRQCPCKSLLVETSPPRHPSPCCPPRLAQSPSPIPTFTRPSSRLPSSPNSRVPMFGRVRAVQNCRPSCDPGHAAPCISRPRGAITCSASSLSCHILCYFPRRNQGTRYRFIVQLEAAHFFWFFKSRRSGSWRLVSSSSPNTSSRLSKIKGSIGYRAL